jgi:hypothetical protein
MRRLTLALVALAALAASPAAAAFTGSLYYTNYEDHHVRMLAVQGGVAGATTDLAALPGADGIMFDPMDPSRLLVGGQLHDNIYSLSTSGGAYSVLNNSPIINGAFHLSSMNPVPTAGLVKAAALSFPTILASSQEGPQLNGLALVSMGTGAVDNRLITGTAMNRVSGVKADAANKIYITDSPNYGLGGQLYTVDLATNGATLVNVANNGNDVSKDLHSLWFDKLTGHLFGGGAKHVEEIDLNALGGPKLVRNWDLSSLIPEPGVSGPGHIDQIASDDFGNMFAASNAGEIIYFDLAGAGTPTLLTSVADVSLDDLVVGPSTVPEPTTLLLTGLGLLGMGLLKRRA